MVINLNDIKSSGIKTFYSTFWENRTIIRDFYEILPEEHYDFRLVNNINTKSDSPRESIAHIINVELNYLEGLKNGKLKFNNSYFESHKNLEKNYLLKEMDRVDKELYDYLNYSDFNLDKKILAPWGQTTSNICIWAMNDHYILHEGWNLALMDIFGIERFQSLKKLWG